MKIKNLILFYLTMIFVFKINTDAGYEFLRTDDLVILIKDSCLAHQIHSDNITIRDDESLVDSIRKIGLPKLAEITTEEYKTLKNLQLPIPYIAFDCTAINIEKIKDILDYLQLLGYTVFNFLAANDASYHFDEWLPYDQFIPALETLQSSPTHSLHGFIFAKIEENKQFVFVIPAYQCKEWYKKNLDSMFCQTYQNWRAIYIDDCSPDETGLLVERYCIEKGFESRVTVIKNTERKLALYNIYCAVQSCADNEIICLLDGDDVLAHDSVLTIVNNVYKNQNIWLTYGNYVGNNGETSCCGPIHQNIIQTNRYRQIAWCTSHLRTFYGWLFKKIKREDFYYENHFLHKAWDLAIMYPLLEMSGGRFQYIPDILYIYNISTPFSENKTTDHAILEFFDQFIRNKKKYTCLLENN